eukprot:Amastigsp_a344065_5.p5 type:complete len:111 gc:universal Amastigsp_a344065_5:247-579(+)
MYTSLTEYRSTDSQQSHAAHLVQQHPRPQQHAKNSPLTTAPSSSSKSFGPPKSSLRIASSTLSLQFDAQYSRSRRNTCMALSILTRTSGVVGSCEEMMSTPRSRRRCKQF